MKRDAIEENHCLRQYPFDVRNFFSVLATPLVMQFSVSSLVLQSSC